MLDSQTDWHKKSPLSNRHQLSEDLRQTVLPANRLISVGFARLPVASSFPLRVEEYASESEQNLNEN